METIAVIIMIILFFVLLAFVFSTALLTPLIGKKNLLFVVGLGFVVGIIGGAFFIAPVFEDIPDMARAVYMSTSSEPEIITLNISTDSNVTKSVEQIKEIQGVKKIESGTIYLKTTPISSDWKSTLESRLPTANKNISSVKIESNETVIVHLKPETEPTDTIKQIKTWINFVSGIDVRFSIVQYNVTVEASKVDEVIRKLPQGEVLVTGVYGPVENEIQSLKNAMPSETNLVLLCGFLGIITGLAGVFIDSIISFIVGLKNRLIKKDE